MFKNQIQIIPGSEAPLYDQATQALKIEKVVIVEKATDDDTPAIDFVMKGQYGEKYVVCISGANVKVISKIVEGMNIKNHGHADL